MDGLSLPFVADDTSIKQAIDHMNMLNSRAVVVNHMSDNMTLYMNQVVLRAYAKRVNLADGMTNWGGTRGASFPTRNLHRGH